MNKVKLTRKQAEAIESLDSEKWEIVQTHIDECWTHPKYKCLNLLGNDEFIKALYIGYEIKQEFAVGDWVYYNDGGEVSIVKIIRLDEEKDRVMFDVNVVWFPIEYIERHATPEEIAEEKERRWWAKHNRGAWELKQGDVLMATRRHIFEVTADPKSHEYGCYTGNDEFDFGITECKAENWKVICFAEERLD